MYDNSNDGGIQHYEQYQSQERQMAEKKVRLLTPVGFAKWAHIHTPKEGFVDKDGRSKGEPKYMIDVCFTADDPAWKTWGGALQHAIKAIPAQTDKRTGEPIKKQVSIKRELDIDDKPTGRFYVTFKTGAKFKPGVFDKFGASIPDSVLIGNESKVRVAYTPSEYTAFGGGIALYLNAVQVLELVEYRPQNAEGYGFDVVPMETKSGGVFDDMPDDIPWEDEPGSRG